LVRALNALVILHWRNFDSEWVVFEQTSGQTHLLTAFQAAALMCLQEVSTDLARVTQYLRDLDECWRHVSEGDVLAVLSNLNSLGLIEARPR